MDIVLLEVGAHVRREYRVNRFAFLELAKGSTFKKKKNFNRKFSTFSTSLT